MMRLARDVAGWGLTIYVTAMVVLFAVEGLTRKEEVYVHLGQANQICAQKDHTARVDIFVDMEKEHTVDFVLTDGTKITGLKGQEVHLKLDHCGMGSHEVKIFIPDIRKEPYLASFSVWECE